MACVKSVNRSASVAMSPEGPYLAAGTMAGAVDMSFSSNANLEIFELDFRSDSSDLPVLGHCQSSERFNRLAWSSRSSNSGSHSLGLIAGGLVDGSIDIWNPEILIRPKENENPLVAHVSYHKEPVRGLEFNTFTPNLLASGADDGEVCIWDLSAPSEPSHFPPLKGIGSASQSEISYVSWNSKVQHILASTSNNGITVVWDLKKQKPVISVEDSLKRRCSVLQWHPDVATQLVVASDDDNSPALRLWDMRNILTPVKEFTGHTKGVIAMSWCPCDSSYLLTCGKDNRTICWNTSSGEIVRELPSGNNWNFDVHWYPKIPGVISASSFDGTIGIYNIEACSRTTANETDFGVSVRAPKWYKKPAGVSFGFGGQLLAFNPKSSDIFIHNLVTEQSLVKRSSEFESSIHHGERSSVKALCEKKVQECESEDERETWAFLKVMFEEDGTARTRMLNHLGFSLPSEETKDANDVLQQVEAIRLDDKPGSAKAGTYGNVSADDGEDFFNNLPSPKADTPLQSSVNEFDNTVSKNESMRIPEESLSEENGDLLDDSIQRALVVGDYKGAVEKCVAANRIADALVISHLGGTSLWEKTCDQYLKSSSSSYLKVVAAMVNNDLACLVNTRPLKYWKETLALFCTFAQSEEWSILCDTLASRLMASGNTLPATLCYICAGNIEKTVQIWSKSISDGYQGKSYVDLLQDLMEKTIVLSLATGQKQFTPSLCQLVEKYTEILVSQGLQKTAMEYLNLVGSDPLPSDLSILKERIAVSIEPEPQAAYETTPRSYLPEPSFHHMQHTTPNPQYSENYPTYGQPASFQPQMYNPPQAPQAASYQPQTFTPSQPPHAPSFQPQMFTPSQTPQATLQPQMFTPSQAPQAPQIHQANFAPPHGGMRTFVPSAGPVLRNADQFQQAPTLGSQLFSGNPQNYQSVQAPPPGPRMPQAALQPPSGFRPIATSGVMQRSAPTSPMHSSSLPASPPPPPPTVQTVDTSSIPAKHKPVVATLTRLFNETSEAMGGARANPARKREIDDNSKKIGALFAKFASDDVSRNASEKLSRLCQELDKQNYGAALQIQVELTTSEWDECNFWLATLKRMIKTKQTSRVS